MRRWPGGAIDGLGGVESAFGSVAVVPVASVGAAADGAIVGTGSCAADAPPVINAAISRAAAAPRPAARLMP